MKTKDSFTRRITAYMRLPYARLLILIKVFQRQINQKHYQTLTLISSATFGLIIVWLTLGYVPRKNDVSGQEQQPAQPSPTRKVLEIQRPFPNNTNSPEATGPSGGKPIEETKVGMGPSPFLSALEIALTKRGTKLSDICATNDPVARRVLEDYGAMYLASEKVLPPTQCVFVSEQEVILFQDTAKFTSVVIGSTRVDLQPAAMDALIAARAEARKQGLDITPRGRDAARRNYGGTFRLWQTRFLPALNYWQQRGRITPTQAARLRQLPLPDQVREVLDLEKRGIYFSKDFSKSILYSIAAPGTSQHIAMLALDVTQYSNSRVRQILARHGWFQTVKSDMPHFTYLGVEEKDLPSLGLRAVPVGGQVFWIPNLEPISIEKPGERR